MASYKSLIPSPLGWRGFLSLAGGPTFPSEDVRGQEVADRPGDLARPL
jgi:hypothetical protein